MRTFRETVTSLLLLGGMLPAICFADSTVVLHVDVQNPPLDPSIRVPDPGDYTLSVSQKRAQIVLPSGAILILDFDKKVVSNLDPKQKTFYQVKLDDYLSAGDKVSPSVGSRYSSKTTLEFEPTVGQDPKTILGLAAAPYNLDAEALLSAQSRGSGGRGGGRRGLGGILGGGGIFGGGRASSGGQDSGFPSGQSSSGSHLTSKGCKIGGELWFANSAVGDCDRAELSVAETCALMRFCPGIKSLADKIRKANITLLAANYSVSLYDSSGLPPLKPPSVNIETKSTGHASFENSLFTIPSYYLKIEAPTSPLGTKF